MTAKKKAKVEVHDLSKRKGLLKTIGGSMEDKWNDLLANQTARTLWVKGLDPDTIRQQRFATVGALIGIKPNDELEGMLAAQLIACHNASMECYRRAASASRRLRAGTKTSIRRTSSRGHMRRCSKRSIATAARVSRRSRSSMFTFTRAARRSSATSRARGEGSHRNQRIKPMQSRLPMHLSHDAERGRGAARLPVTGDAERPLPDARRTVTGRSEG